MRELVEPEIKACITTLNNVESEMEFFHANQTRAVQIAQSIGADCLQAGSEKVGHRVKCVCMRLCSHAFICL